MGAGVFPAPTHLYLSALRLPHRPAAGTAVLPAPALRVAVLFRAAQPVLA